MAAGLELPKKIISHAHWTVNKVKMSKSLGNVVCPNQLIDTYCLDPVRYFLLSEGIPYYYYYYYNLLPLSHPICNSTHCIHNSCYNPAYPTHKSTHSTQLDLLLS
jgi:cysteinyl-tRNA synthetase